jgi:hypothetical protein
VTTRTSRRTVTFQRPFSLNGFDRPQAAGTYTVETEEELLDVSFPAYRRLATWIHLHAQPGSPLITETVSIDPEELDAALVRDTPAALS